MAAHPHCPLGSEGDKGDLNRTPTLACTLPTSPATGWVGVGGAINAPTCFPLQWAAQELPCSSFLAKRAFPSQAPP